MDSYLEYEINKELAECYLFMNDLDKAENYYRKAHVACGTYGGPLLGLATVAVQRGELEIAMDFYQEAFEVEPSDKALTGKGLVSMEQGEAIAAFDYFCEALILNNVNAVALNCLIREAYALARVDEAIPFLERAITSDGENIELHIALAGCLMSVGSPKEAKPHLEFVLERNPDAAAARDLYNHIAA